MFRALTLLPIFSLLIAANAYAADITEQTASPSMVKQLDGLLAADDEDGLRAVIRKPADKLELEQSTSWLAGKVHKGGSAYLSLIYSRNMWDMAHHESDGKHAEELRFSAYVHALYVFTLLQLDGEKCADPTAANSHLAFVYHNTAPQLTTLAAQSTIVQKNAIHEAMLLEKRTAALRKDDIYICREEGGIHATPNFLHAESHKTAQENDRAMMPEHLAQVIQRFDATKAAPPQEPPPVE